MFWNCYRLSIELLSYSINRKHEMFWNTKLGLATTDRLKLTVNMKCFEIQNKVLEDFLSMVLTVNMKCFEIKIILEKF